MAYTGYINDEVRAMYGIPYHELTAEQKRILHADSVRRAKLIKEREDAVLKNNLKAFEDEAKMEKVLASIYKDTQNQIIADVTETIAKVKKAGGTWSYANQSALTRSRGLFEQITAELTKLGQKEQALFTQGLSSIYTDQFLRQVYELGQGIPVKANFNRLNPALIKKTLDYPWSGAMFSDRIWLDKEQLGKNLRVGLTQSMILGEGIPEITDRINKNINTSRYNAERLARTETKRVTYVAHNDAYEDMGVEELEYRCANGGDHRVCKVCLGDNGKKFKRGKEPTLPRHPNCRCVYIPVVSDEFGDNELNELTGSVRGAENYEKWRKAEEAKLKDDKIVNSKEDKYNKALARVDAEYKAKDLEIVTLQSEYDALDKQYWEYANVRRGLVTPEEAGFTNKVEFERVDKDLKTKLQDVDKRLDEAKSELKDLINDRAYLLKVGAEKTDTLEDYQIVRKSLKKNSTFDYDKYLDDLTETMARMDANELLLQKEFFTDGSNADLKALKPSEIFKGGAISNVRLLAKFSRIDYNEVKELQKKLTVDEIVARLGGGDKTKGSCSSLGFAYIGNHNGLNVLDFRGGKSQEFFSRNNAIVKIAKLPKVVSAIEETYNDFDGAMNLLNTIKEGKIYYLATGKHASIVRKVGNSYEYLELQSATDNGFHKLTKQALKYRFGCQKSHTSLGIKYKVKNVLIDADSLKDNKEFRKILGYINTAGSDQKKGVAGYAK